MSEIILVKRKGEYRVQSRDRYNEDGEIISYMDIPMDNVRSMLHRVTGEKNGFFYLYCDDINDRIARYMFKDVVGDLLGISKG